MRLVNAKQLPGVPRLTQRRLKEHLTITCAKAGEYQRRGLVHFHVVIRFDGPDPEQLTPPPVWATLELLDEAIRHAAARAVVKTPDIAGLPAREIRWGEQLYIRPITAFAPGDSTQLTDLAGAAYVAKGAAKGAEDAGTLDRPLWCRHCQGTGIFEIPEHPAGPTMPAVRRHRTP